MAIAKKGSEVMIAETKKAVCVAGKTATNKLHKGYYSTPQNNHKWFSELLSEAMETAMEKEDFRRAGFLHSLIKG